MNKYMIYKEDTEDDIIFRLYYRMNNVNYKVVSATVRRENESLDQLISRLDEELIFQHDKFPIGKLFYTALSVKQMKSEIRKKFPEEFI